MTAFARTQENATFARFSWEIRSVNQRYLEVNLRLPEGQRHLEPAIRTKIKQHLSRGKVDVSLSYEKPPIQQSLQVNMAVLEPLSTAINQVQQTMIEATQVNPLEVLQWPGVLHENTCEHDSEEIDEQLITSLVSALHQLNQHRLREGQSLAQMILERCAKIEQNVANLTPKLSQMLTNHTDKLKLRIESLAQQVDENRFHQEVAILAQKMDVAEELDRLSTHILEVKHILDAQEAKKTAEQNAPIGRRLDFLMQELNREANTLGSKAIDSEISQTSVELKVLIEQMREQVQNIE